MIFLTTVTTVTPVNNVNKYFLSTFVKSNLIHLTTDMMFSGQRFAILAKKKLQRGCVIFLLTHSLRLHDLFFWRLRAFFCGEVARCFC